MSPVSISEHPTTAATAIRRNGNGHANDAILPTHANGYSSTPLPIDPTAARRPVEPITVDSPNLVYTPDALIAKYTFHSTAVKRVGDRFEVKPVEKSLQFKTDRRVPKAGYVLV